MEFRLFFEEFYGTNEKNSEATVQKKIQNILATHAHKAHWLIAATTWKNTEKFH